MPGGLAVQALRDCLVQCQQVEGLLPQDCQSRCNSLTPGDIAVPVGKGMACTDFWSCYAADITASSGSLVHNAVASVAGLLNDVGQGIGGAIGGALGGAVSPLKLPLGLIVVGLIAVAVIVVRAK